MTDKRNDPDLKNMETSSQNGRLRLGLLIVVILVFWSILAFIASINNPFPALPSLWPFKQTSGNLASDLLDDILDSFFSLYAIAYLLLGTIALVLSYLMVRNLIAGACRLSEKRSSGKFLENRLFSIPAYPEVDAQEKGFRESDQYKILTTMGGPCLLKLGVNFGAVLQRSRKNRVVLTAQDEGGSFFINDREKLIALIDMNEQQVRVSTSAICGNGRRLQIRNMQVTANFISADMDSSNKKNKRICEQALKEAAVHSQGTQWNEFITSRLHYELKASLLAYSSMQIQQYLDRSVEVHAQPDAHIHKHLTHAASRHGRIYLMPEGSFSKRETGIILRNRRRSILPELRKRDPIEIQTEAATVKKLDFKDELAEKVTRSFNATFHFPIVRFTIKRIGDITFDGIH